MSSGKKLYRASKKLYREFKSEKQLGKLRSVVAGREVKNTNQTRRFQTEVESDEKSIDYRRNRSGRFLPV